MPTPVKQEALALGIATSEPARLGDVASALAAQHADLFAVVSYGKIVPQAVLDIPRLGALNVHPSLLPLYRGATPLQSVLRDGQAESGVSVIRMDAGMDTGDIVLQERYPVGPRETYGELHDRFATIGARLLVSAVEGAAAGALTGVPQATFGVPEAEIAATLTHPLRAGDLAIDWSWSSQRIADAVRSLSPAPLARACVPGRNEIVKIVAARPVETDAAGAAWIHRDDLFVACGQGVVALERLIPPNRAAMSGAAYLRSKAGVA